MFKFNPTATIFSLLLFTLFANLAIAQENPTEPNKKKKPKDEKTRVVTIPISILTKDEIKEKQTEEFIEAGNIIVKENKDEQLILSIRSVRDSPLTLAVLIQDDLVSQVNLELKKISEFISRLPKGSRVMVAYIRGGSLQVRQKFTEDLEKASKALRIVSGNSIVAANNPFDGIMEATGRFDSIPNGRRAMLVISDGLDASRGLQFTSPTESLDLDKAILKAQKRGIAIYSIYSAGSITENASSMVILNGQGSLNKLSEETGGRAFFQGTITPISFDPFFRDINLALNRQFALTYLSNHTKKGYYKIQVLSTNPEIKIEHPKGIYHR